MAIPPYEPPAEIWERRKLGIELRQKYELYFVSLIFTLAAASVQTASHTGPRWRVVTEVIGWVCLLAAGLIGLWRISQLWRREIHIADSQASGKFVGSPHSVVVATDWIRRFGTAQISAFILGFVAIIVSRAVLLLCGGT